MKENKGITLIALVITIVVLIILAGVTIALTMSETGIMNKAKLATSMYSNSVNKENNELEKGKNEIDLNISSSREDIASLQEEINDLRSQLNSTSSGVAQGTGESGVSLSPWLVEKQGNRIFINGVITASYSTAMSWKKIVTGLPRPLNSIQFPAASDHFCGRGYISASGELYLAVSAVKNNAPLAVNFSYVVNE